MMYNFDKIMQLLESLGPVEEDPILCFEEEYRFLSNFWPAPVTYEGLTYPTVEHAFQAAKTLDKEERMMICCQATPGQAKKAGRKVHLRSDWNQIKLDVMEELVRQKFTRHPVLKQKLLDTGHRPLVEGNLWGDIYWGVFNGKGQNNLGKILMKIRAELENA